MKITRVLPLLLIAATATAAQDSFVFGRKYTAGEKDTYTMKMQMDSAMGTINLNMVFAQEIQKVHENGEADIATSVSEMKVQFNGQEMPGGPMPPQTVQRMDKFGRAVGKNAGGSSNMNFLQFSGVIGGVDLKVGKETPFEYKDPENTKNTVKGTVLLESIQDGLAKAVAKFDVTFDGQPKPMKMVMTSWFETATSKVRRAEGTATDVPGMEQAQVRAIQFTIERS